MKFKIEAYVALIGDNGKVKFLSAVKKFNKQHRGQFPHVNITAINGKEVRGLCETCSIPILEGESIGPYSDVVICSDCEYDKELNG